jgi:TIR domain
MTVYLSASRQDILLREALVAALEESGETVWWDEQRGRGEAWWHNSVRQLRRCDVFVFALSYSSVASDICQAELKYAREIGKPILPVLVGSVGREQDNPFDDRFVESAVEFRRPSTEAAAELRNRVRGLRGFSVLAGQPQPASPSHTPSTDGIFISYRRGNENFFATWLYGKLADRFGKSRVFMDVDSIDLGLDFTEVIDEKLSHCVAMLVVIGKDWVTVSDASGDRPRLHDCADFVRLEVEKGLTRPGVRVIPIYVDGAPPPRADDLPDSLAKLAVRNGIAISHASSESGLERLVKTLERVVGQGS